LRSCSNAGPIIKYSRSTTVGNGRNNARSRRFTQGVIDTSTWILDELLNSWKRCTIETIWLYKTSLLIPESSYKNCYSVEGRKREEGKGRQQGSMNVTNINLHSRLESKSSSIILSLSLPSSLPPPTLLFTFSAVRIYKSQFNHQSSMHGNVLALIYISKKARNELQGTTPTSLATCAFNDAFFTCLKCHTMHAAPQKIAPSLSSVSNPNAAK
jgi:hypothetical protein